MIGETYVKETKHRTWEVVVTALEGGHVIVKDTNTERQWPVSVGRFKLEYKKHPTC